MNRDAEIRNYENLNRSCRAGATVIFGNARDLLLPIRSVCEYFFVKADVINRSFPSLSVKEAAELYMRCIAPIRPGRVLIRLSDEVMDAEFDREFVNLMNVIGKEVEVGIIASGREADDKHLMALCDSCRAAFCDPDEAGCDLETLRDLFASGLRKTTTIKTFARMLYSNPEETAEQPVVVNVTARRTFADFFRIAEAR